MNNLPSVTQNLLFANLIVWLLDSIMQRYGLSLTGLFGLHYVTANAFFVWQPLTYMFMHAGFRHLFFNMFALLMFGPVLEREWGARKFLVYYLVCGIGAAIIQESVWAIDFMRMAANAPTEYVQYLSNQAVTIGASGAVFGILFAFGWLFPNVPMFLFFIPIPIRARTMVIGYAVIELLEGFSSIPGDNVAHFAHLGGMLFGWLLLLWWRKHDMRWDIGSLFKRKRKADKGEQFKDFSGYHYQKRVND